jgi:glycerophosphoryl diester phosphodiesterase
VAKPLDYAGFAQAMEADLIFPFYECLDGPFVRDAHQRGIKVIAWTINRPEDIKEIAEMGVDGIISNYPDLIPSKEK